MSVTIQVLLAAVVVVAALNGVAEITALPPRVDRLTIVNPHPYHVTVAVSDGGEGWLTVGDVRRNRSAVYEEVIDQGSTWHFRFAYAGVEAAELVVSGSSLEADGGKVSVPPEAAQRLDAEGLGPSAR